MSKCSLKKNFILEIFNFFMRLARSLLSAIYDPCCKDHKSIQLSKKTQRLYKVYIGLDKISKATFKTINSNQKIARTRETQPIR